jgi:hypothetical protein
VRLSSELALAAVLVAFQVALLLLMRETSRTADNDPLDSSFFWYSWLILPGCAFLASYARPDGARPFLWTAALIGPFVIELALLGTVWHDPDEGASFWLVGEMFVLILGAVTFAAASAGASIALRRRAR